jgi:hypothetical protein
MQRTTILLAIGVAIAAGATAQGRTYDIGAFERIEADAAITVLYRPASGPSARVEAQGDDYSDIRFETKGDTLVITRESMSRRGWFGRSRTSISVSDDGRVVKVNGREVPAYTVHIAGPALTGADARRSSRIEASGIRSGAFDASASSAGRVTLAGEATRARLKASSSGEIDAASFVSGKASLEASSGGRVSALLAGSGENSVAASSSGRISLRSTGPADFDIKVSSAGRVEAEGECRKAVLSASSSGTLKAAGLTCGEVTASASSGADIEAFAAQSTVASASSGADIRIAGNPSGRQANRSSGGGVKFVD